MFKKEAEKIVLKPLIIKTMKVQIIGKSDLLQNKMSEKTKDMLERKMEGKGNEKANRDFLNEVEGKCHKIDAKGTIGIPTTAFKNAIIESSVYIDGMSKKLAKSIIIEGDYVPLKYKSRTVNKTMGRPRMSATPMPIYRPQFKDWSCELTVSFNSSQISPEVIINLFRLAGFHNGVGSWSPAKSGSYGCFDVKI